jgi:hypothetical protein
MRWISACLFLGVLSLAAVSRGQDPAAGTAVHGDYGTNQSYVDNGDPWNDSVMPVGLRFTEPQAAILLGCGQGYCGGACGLCTHWATRPWYAHWGPDGFGNVGHKHCHKRACCVNPCADWNNCGCQ